ncbi:LysR family transcriptional regulator [Actinospica sp.]|jgi:DNA-binding transcriptional LysR family regulator|uniref:LysR family transcriptional regulator n=1 Tax=Actinospica sp. TaxID=1872142 RepID=UPI002C5D44E4|nr:LysR family transcriptional regulator [Actinospica sp.]HWG25240.1 LysR family transcriptional regulator [Actinospica sp.]
MLDVHRLRLLRELDRRGTLKAVAEALSYSPSAISQQLSQLEAETGVTLLEPAGRGVRLTAQARILVAHTEVILERLELAEADLRASLTEVGGTLRVASFQSVLLALVPPALTLLAEQHPGLRVEITHEEAGPAFAGLLAHEFDVVLGEEYPGLPQPPVEGVHTQLLALDELLLAVPTHGPHARGGGAKGDNGSGNGDGDGSAGDCGEDQAPVRLAELADVPWALDPPDIPVGQWARTLCRGAGFEPDIRFASPDLLLQIHLVETGHAVALLPGLLLDTDRGHDMRVSRLPGRPHRRLITGVRAGAARHPAVRAFRSALKQGLKMP